MRYLYLCLGFLMLILAFIGALLPIMPTVPFVIAAAWFFSRSSSKLNNWLHNHKIFGPFLTQWREKGAISVPAKFMAVGGMGAGYASFYFFTKPSLWLALVVAALLLLVAAYILSRPSD